ASRLSSPVSRQRLYDVRRVVLPVAVSTGAVSASSLCLPLQKRLERLLDGEERDLILQIGLFACHDRFHTEIVRIDRPVQFIPLKRSGNPPEYLKRIGREGRRNPLVTRPIHGNA